MAMQRNENGMAVMLREIGEEVAYTRSLTGVNSLSSRVMEAMASVPRHEFVPEYERRNAYANNPLFIGHGQTISQPFMVALMTELLEPEAEDVMLEIGTGSGYQTAVLSTLVKRVYSVEIIPALAASATERLSRLQFSNVECRSGNGYAGWPEHAPFDGIIVTAAAPMIPRALVDQLKPGACLVIPVGQPYSYQELMLLRRGMGGEDELSSVIAVSFVPLVEEPEL
jgi:protein-L-isoaspartate(D-aspartate) O-methyltransferase